jgi:hypothetical protein
MKTRTRTQKRARKDAPILVADLHPYLRELGCAYLRAPAHTAEEEMLEKVLSLAAARHGYTDDGAEIVALLCSAMDRCDLPEDDAGIERDGSTFEGRPGAQ